MNWAEALLEPSFVILRKIFIFFLILLTVFIFLIFGWLLALLIRKIIVALLKKIEVDKLFADNWIRNFLVRGGITKTPSELLGKLFYWVIIIIAVILASQSLGLETTGNLLDRFLIFLPRVIAFGLIIMFGVIFGNFVGRLIQVISGNLGIKEAKILGRIVQAVVILYAGILALEQLGIAIFTMAASFNIFLAAICLTLALALGLGGKDLVKSFLDNFIHKKMANKENAKKQNIQKQTTKKSKTKRDLEQEEMFPYG